MRTSMHISFLVLLTLLYGCKHKYGIHEIVDFDETNRASSDVYISYLTDQIDRYPKEEDNYIKLANIYKVQNNTLEAIELLQKGERRNPENVDILINLSALYLKEEDVDRLSSALNTIRKIDPDNMEFLKLSAGYSLLLRDYTNAIFFANRAILANPYDDENLFLRGRAQLINRDSINALISFQEAYKLKSSYKNFSKIVFVALALGNHALSRKYLDEFSANNADYQLCYEWGAYHSEVEDYDTAKVILSQCLLQKPEEPKINFELAKIFYRRNNIDSALHFVNQYIREKPAEVDGYVLKAKALEKISYYTEAKKLYNQALEIDSASAFVKRSLEELERKVAYLRLIRRKESLQRQVEMLKPLNSKEIN